MESIENDGGEEAKKANVAAKIKEFANAAAAAAAATDANDADESKKENDEYNDDGVYEVLPSVTKVENGWILHWKAATNYGILLLIW
jgi:hypothetical protein